MEWRMIGTGRVPHIVSCLSPDFPAQVKKSLRFPLLSRAIPLLTQLELVRHGKCVITSLWFTSLSSSTALSTACSKVVLKLNYS